MALTVRRASARDLPSMFELGRTLHGTDPNWVAPLAALEQLRLRPANAFFERAELEIYLAERDGQLVGSMSALVDHSYNKGRDEPVAWFGYYDVIDDLEVVTALLDRVKETARAWGCERLRGPRNLSRFDQIGLTVQGFDRLPPMLQNQHPAYFAAHLEAAGLVTHHDRLAYEIDLFTPDGTPRPLPKALADKAANCTLQDLVVRRARWRSIQRDLADAHEVLNESYRTVPDVSPMPRSTFMAIGRVFLLVADKRLVQLAYHRGRPVAFTVCLPEINEALVHARGTVPGLANALACRGEVRTAAFKLIGVLPEYRGTGLHARMIDGVVQGARDAGYTRIDGSIIDERNGPMRAVVESAGMEVYRRYRLYDATL